MNVNMLTRKPNHGYMGPHETQSIKRQIDLMANEAQRSGKCCLYLSSQRKYAADKICIRNVFDRVLYKKNFHVRFQSFSKRPMRNGHRFAIIKETH